jgi:MFS family permease
MKYIFGDKNLTILFISTFLFFTNEALFLPTLPLHLSQAGYSNIMIGSVLGAFGFGVLLARPLSGYITDNFGRKISLSFGAFFFFAAPLFYLVSTNFIYLIIIRLFHGLGIAFYTTAFPAYITDKSAVEQRGEIMGHMTTSMTLAFTFGPLIGITVFSTYGFKRLMFLCTLTGLLNLIVILLIQESHKTKKDHKKMPYSQVVFKRSILVSSFIQLIYGIIFGGVMTFLPLLLNTVSGVNIGIYFLVESIMIVVCRILAANLSDKMGKVPVFSYSFLIILIAVFLISGINNLTVMVITAIFFGAGSALCAPALTTFIADSSDPSARGTVFSFFSGAFDIGVIAAGVILGFIADITGIRMMFMITSFSGLICLILFTLFIKKGRKQSLIWALSLKNYSGNNRK